jgi:hypothetical protein
MTYPLLFCAQRPEQGSTQKGRTDKHEMSHYVHRNNAYLLLSGSSASHVWDKKTVSLETRESCRVVYNFRPGTEDSVCLFRKIARYQT